MHLIIVINWRDNPWWNDASEALRKRDRQELTRAKYDWIWEGAFNDEVEGSIIKAEWFDAAIDAHKDDRFVNFFSTRGLSVAAHDPSDSGRDDAALVVRENNVITHVAAMAEGEIDVKADWATHLALKKHVDWFLWDGDGMGTGLKRQISDAMAGKRTQYHMFKGSLSGKAQDNADIIYDKDGSVKGMQFTYKETFKNNRSQYYHELARRLYNTYKVVEKGEWIDPNECLSISSEGVDNLQALRSEVCRIPEKNQAGGLVQIMSKQDMKKLGISSPNLADSLMMSMWNPKEKRAHALAVPTFKQHIADDYDPFNY